MPKNFRPRKFHNTGLDHGVDTAQIPDYDEVMTYIAAIDPNSRQNVDVFAAVDHADQTMPGWWEAEQTGTRFLSERDFPVYDTSADEARVPNEDWEAMGELLYRTSDWY